jgi:toxin ParE1/3/4
VRLKLRFTPRAARELEEQYTWYEFQRPGLGDEYFANASATFAAIQNNPALHPVVRPRIRRASMGRFPYALFYTASSDAVTVVALVHGRRHPRTWPRKPG